MRRVFIIPTAILFVLSGHAKSQSIPPDTTRISFPAAEKIFLQKNLSLLAAKYNIDANEALIKQAKLWDNPVLATDQNIYDGEKGEGKFFRHTSTEGQFFIQLSQLIKTAGKRSKLAQLAADNTKIARAQFDDVMRTLRYTLRSDMVEVDHQLQIRKVYDTQIIELQQLVKGMDEEYKAGNIALKDNIRVKALLFSLQNELINVTSAIMQAQSEIKLLLQTTDSSFIVPEINYQPLDLAAAAIPTSDSLVRYAINNRPEAAIVKLGVDYQKDNLTYQRSLAVPDITIGSEYDQHSSYNPNYIGLAISLPINIFNRNQGNIKSAEFSIRQQQTLNNYQYSKIENEVIASVNKLKYFQQVNNSQQLDFANKYDALFRNVLRTYQARQISLLEFLDFMDAYKDTKLKLIEQHNSLVKAIEELNYTTNSVIINIQ